MLYLLATLSVREVSEADDKYSAVISAPFPLSTLNIVFGSMVLLAKSKPANKILLHFYFLPVFLVTFVLFTAYQIVLLPFCYVKMVGHKWALMIKAPTGKGSMTTLDRAFQAVIFMVSGPLLLMLACFVDSFWFICHVYKTDLDKNEYVNEHQSKGDSPELNRRVFKKMNEYFSKSNEQLVL